MLRLDVERLKGELAGARKDEMPAEVDFRGGVRGKYAGPATANPVTRVIPADAVCGGPGRCGKLLCAHPGWK